MGQAGSETISSLPRYHKFYQTCGRSVLKTLQKKEKMIVARMFSFFPNLLFQK